MLHNTPVQRTATKCDLKARKILTYVLLTLASYTYPASKFHPIMCHIGHSPDCNLVLGIPISNAGLIDGVMAEAVPLDVGNLAV